MKTFVFRRNSLCVLALVAMAHLTMVNPIFAKGPQSPTDPPQAQVEYSADELELLRASLLNIAGAVKEMSELLPDNAKGLDRLEELKAQLERLPAKNLATLRRAIDPSGIDWTGLTRARQTLADHNHSEASLALKRRTSQNSDFSLSSTGFPVPPAATVCGGSRISQDEMSAADLVYLIAEEIAIEAKDACLQTAVVLGEGGNTSLACIFSDAVFGIAKGVWATLHFCDDNVTRAMVDTSYDRLAHIHTDLENSVANDNANTAAIKANADSNAASIKSNTDSKAASIISNANSNTTTITNNASSNTTTILNAISGAASTITSGSSTSQTQVKDLIVDTQIEADLARDTASTPVARFLLPASAGGLLDRVRTVVADTIAAVQAAGGTVGTAQTFLSQGDAAKASGQFKQAYDFYRRAYQMAARF